MRLLVAFLLMGILSACGSERPVPVNHLVSTESVMASAEHWQALAADVADHLLEIQPQVPLIAVDPPQEKTPFGNNFHEMLITELFKRGFDVSDQAPLHVAFDWSVISHPANKQELTSKTFEAVGVGAGIYGLYRLVHDTLNPTTGAALGAVAAGGLIAGSWIADNATTELVITTTVRDPAQIIHRQTDIYYLQDGEASNFKKNGDALPTITYAQFEGSGEGLTDLTKKAHAYCAKQNAVAVLNRRYVTDSVRYNKFVCITPTNSDNEPPPDPSVN